MKSRGIVYIFLGALALLAGNPPLIPQEKGRDATEFVEVINVEVYVRALQNGQPVTGLKKSDFSLLENSKKVEITSFMEVKHKMKDRQKIEFAVDEQEKPYKKRLFIFYLWIFERETAYKDALDYFFEKIYHPDDSVLFFLKNQVLRITGEDQIKPVMQKMETSINTFSSNFQTDAKRLVEKMETIANDLLAEVNQSTINIQNLRFLKEQIRFKLENIWQEFHYKNFAVDAKQLLSLADSLKKLDCEKWGIVFYQDILFPYFDQDKISKRMMYELPPEAQKEFNEIKDFLRLFELKTRLPYEEINRFKEFQDTLIDANTTFHVLIPQTREKMEYISENLKMENIYPDWIETFKGISRATGGDTIRGNALKKAFEEIVEREDVYYRLTYSPAQAKKGNRKVTILVNRKGLEIFHNEQIKLEKPKWIEIGQPSYTDSVLSFTLKGYHRIYENNRLHGNVLLTIQSYDGEGNEMESQRTLDLETPEADISLRLKLPQDKWHSVTVNVYDNYTGKQAKSSLVIGSRS